MAEYTRGQEGRREGHSGHNQNNMEKARRRNKGVGFENMNFEERRAPYGHSGRPENEEKGNAPKAPGDRRDDR